MDKRLHMNYDWIAKSTIGILGTTLSVMLENLSTLASIVAAIATAIYMFQQFRNARNRGIWAKQDREEQNE